MRVKTADSGVLESQARDKRRYNHPLQDIEAMFTFSLRLTTMLPKSCCEEEVAVVERKTKQAFRTSRKGPCKDRQSRYDLTSSPPNSAQTCQNIWNAQGATKAHPIMPLDRHVGEPMKAHRRCVRNASRLNTGPAGTAKHCGNDIATVLEGSIFQLHPTS